MKTKKTVFLALVLTLGLSSCNHELETNQITKHESVINFQDESKEQSMIHFANILSKASYANKSVRAFLKAQALKRIDNDYNVFYPLAKDELIDGKNSFRSALLQFTDEEKLSQIEANLPLLNIYIPDFTSKGITALDTEDMEIPVLAGRSLYVNGEYVDSIPENTLPGYHLFVVTESGSIQLSNSVTRSANSLSGSRYEYVADCFNPAISREEKLVTRSNDNPEYDAPSRKHDSEGEIPVEELDDVLVEAYKNSMTNRRMTRSMMYYGMKNINDAPSTLRGDVHECIFRFKIAPGSFEELQRVATGDYPEFSQQRKNLIYKTHVSQDKHPLSRTEILNKMLTGRAFCFLFQLEGQVNGNIVRSEEMKVYARPEQLFNFRISWSKRHKTAFRRSRYYYDLIVKEAKPKWFYPLDHSHDTRLNRWDITRDPLAKRIKIFLINPDEGTTETRKEEYEVTLTTAQNVELTAEADIDSVVKLGANGKLGKTHVERRLVSTEYTLKKNNMFIDEFYFDFFEDYPISELTDKNTYVLPARKGKGIIEMSILPITHDYFNVKRFKTLRNK